MKTLTNILNYEINRDAINNDFYIVRFENEIDFKKVNSRLLDNPDINILSLSYSYGKKNYIGLSEEGQVERVYQHLLEKYGENGYAKVCLEDKEYDEAVGKLRQALSNKKEFLERTRKVVKDI